MLSEMVESKVAWPCVPDTLAIMALKRLIFDSPDLSARIRRRLTCAGLTDASPCRPARQGQSSLGRGFDPACAAIEPPASIGTRRHESERISARPDFSVRQSPLADSRDNAPS